ncbi:MAG: CocE/NonD family hydrolase [Bacteroidia bacterium]|nr:CocE/NonD family hydrolase [Bacteroidia bacterium]
MYISPLRITTALATVFLVLLRTAAWSQSTGPVADPFAYPEADAAAYDDFSFQSTYVELSDGTRIAADVYLPVGGPPAASFPVIFQFTPYNRAILIPNFGPVKYVGAKVLGLGSGPVFDMSEIEKNMAFLLTHGYAMVVADMRGTGASFGSQLPLMPQLGRDGKEMIDWIAAQPWCDGNVGMMGMSYLGWIQYMTAANQPEALKCIMPEVIGFEMYSAANRPGGILAKRWISSFDKVLMRLNRNWYDLGMGAVPALPVIDMDGDGKITDEWPRMDSTSQEAGEMPRYKDRQPRPENPYFAATLEHLDNVLVREMAADTFRFYDAPGPSGYETIGFQQVSPSLYLPEIIETGIPIYQVGGWFDGFCKGTFRYYASLGEEYPARLFVAPRFHFGDVSGPYTREFDYEGKYVKQLGWEQLRFFDKYLKGKEHALDNRPPVLIYVMNDGWRFEQEWPLASQQMTPFYLQAAQGLGPLPATAGSDDYLVDFNASSNYGRHRRNRWLMTSTGPGVVMRRTKLDEQCLSFDSEPLESGTEVTGHPIVHLWVSANQSNGDFFVYLEDVAPNGTATYVTEGQLRAGFRRLTEDDDMVNGRYDVLPELPWHGYKEQDWLEDALGESPVEITFDLMPTSWLFRPGHKIRISIAGADKGNFQLPPSICPEGTVGSCVETIYTFHRGEVFPSRIELPIIQR